MNRKVRILTDNPSGSLDLDGVRSFLQKYHNDIDLAGEIFDYLSLSDVEREDYESFLESIRIADIEHPLDNIKSNKPKETNISRPPKDLYDGFWLQRKLKSLIDERADTIDRGDLIIIITGLLFGTFGDKRYHARVIMLGEPNLISTSGVVEAPARPREYYWIKARFLQTGRDISEIDEIYRDRYTLYNDERMTEIISSYALQALAYELKGEPFCDNKKCCLYNSHWQEEVLDFQYGCKPCEECENLLRAG